MNMSNTYETPRQPRHWGRRLVMVGIVTALLLVGATFGVRRWYDANLLPVSSTAATQYVTIQSGATLTMIAKQLYAAHLIRSEQAFSWYVGARGDRDALQAGTYSLSPSQSVPQIAQIIIHGTVATDLVTILPGQRLDQIRQAFIKAGFAPAAIDAAFHPVAYRASYPALANNPPSSSLEGFLYPDSYQKTATTDPKEIIAESLTLMQSKLTDDVRSGFATQGLTVYQGVTLASIVEQEVPRQSDREQAAQVFLKRLKLGMMLGSDVTAYYGAILGGVAPSVSYDSAYNTRIHTGFPPGPISNVSASSLSAVAHPAATDWLYFVAGDDGTTHFAKNEADHETNITQYCHKLCGAP